MLATPSIVKRLVYYRVMITSLILNLLLSISTHIDVCDFFNHELNDRAAK